MKRYNIVLPNGQDIECADGFWCKWEDVSELIDANLRLIVVLAECDKKLKAAMSEVVRLREEADC